MSTFDETMENSRIFLTYSLAMTLLGKSSQILAERGGDPKAIYMITLGIEKLAQQLRDWANANDTEKAVHQPTAETSRPEELPAFLNDWLLELRLMHDIGDQAVDGRSR